MTTSANPAVAGTVLAEYSTAAAFAGHCAIDRVKCLPYVLAEAYAAAGNIDGRLAELCTAATELLAVGSMVDGDPGAHWMSKAMKAPPALAQRMLDAVTANPDVSLTDLMTGPVTS